MSRDGVRERSSDAVMDIVLDDIRQMRDGFTSHASSLSSIVSDLGHIKECLDRHVEWEEAQSKRYAEMREKDLKKLDDLKEDVEKHKNRIIGWSSAASVFGAGFVWLIDRLFLGRHV